MDILKDKNRSKLFFLKQNIDFPEYVDLPAIEKLAGAYDKSVRQEVADTRLPANSFADTVAKEYPIDSKGDTWLSMAYYNNFAKEASDDTETNLVDAAIFWGIPEEDVEKTEKVEILPKEAEAIATIDYVDNNDETFHTSNIYKQADFNAVYDDILDDSLKYPYAIRKNVAKQLLKNAGAGTYEIDENKKEMLYKVAGDAIGTLKDVFTTIGQRKAALSSIRHERVDELRKKLDNTMMNIHKCSSSGFVSPTTLQKAASIIDTIDRFSNMHTFYQKGQLHNPEKDIMRMPYNKVKSLQKNAIITPNNKVLNKRDIEDQIKPISKVLKMKFGIQADSSDEIQKQFKTFPKEAIDFLEHTINE